MHDKNSTFISYLLSRTSIFHKSQFSLISVRCVGLPPCKGVLSSEILALDKIHKYNTEWIRAIIVSMRQSEVLKNGNKTLSTSWNASSNHF